MTIHTRSANLRDHRVQTPETFVRAPLPGMRHATAIVHASPAGGTRFVQYTAEFEPGGCLAASGDQRFVYVLDGHLVVGGAGLAAGDFAYVAAGADTTVAADTACRAAVIEKPYDALVSARPASFTGRESQVAPTHLAGDPWLEVRALLPDDTVYDFRVNTMTFQPGAALPAVEIHVMEHGLLMLEGVGIYRLGSEWYPVEAGDFIWMGPYVPQSFFATGSDPARYIYYKNVNRDVAL